MSFEQLALIIFACGMVTALYLEHRGVSDLKWLARKLWIRWKEKK